MTITPATQAGKGKGALQGPFLAGPSVRFQSSAIEHSSPLPPYGWGRPSAAACYTKAPGLPGHELPGWAPGGPKHLIINQHNFDFILNTIENVAFNNFLMHFVNSWHCSDLIVCGLGH